MARTKLNIGISHGTSRAMWRRASDPRFVNRYFAGKILDVGGAIDGLELASPFFPLIEHVDTFDQEDGDAQLLPNIKTGSYDTLYSSHTLEHLVDPVAALGCWIEVVRPGGYLVITVPDEDLYEQGIFPSTFNDDHRHTFTVAKKNSWSPASINVVDLVSRFRDQVDVLKIELLDHLYRYDLPRFDKCLIGYCESSIEFILRKK
jgi:SAM-dependent methyltransferase